MSLISNFEIFAKLVGITCLPAALCAVFLPGASRRRTIKCVIESARYATTIKGRQDEQQQQQQGGSLPLVYYHRPLSIEQEQERALLTLTLPRSIFNNYGHVYEWAWSDLNFQMHDVRIKTSKHFQDVEFALKALIGDSQELWLNQVDYVVVGEHENPILVLDMSIAGKPQSRNKTLHVDIDLMNKAVKREVWWMCGILVGGATAFCWGLCWKL